MILLISTALAFRLVARSSGNGRLIRKERPISDTEVSADGCPATVNRPKFEDTWVFNFIQRNESARAMEPTKLIVPEAGKKYSVAEKFTAF